MLSRRLVALVAVLIGAGVAIGVCAALVYIPRALKQYFISSAISDSQALYICKPSGTTTTPQCPIDTLDEDETTFGSIFPPMQGTVVWEKIRVRNVGTKPWDVTRIRVTWGEPDGTPCDTFAEGIVYDFNGIQVDTNTVPGVTILGKVGGAVPDPVEKVMYDPVNDNHAGSLNLPLLNSSNSSLTVHVAPGDYEDLLLGIRWHAGMPAGCGLAIHEFLDIETEHVAPSRTAPGQHRPVGRQNGSAPVSVTLRAGVTRPTTCARIITRGCRTVPQTIAEIGGGLVFAGRSLPLRTLSVNPFAIR